MQRPRATGIQKEKFTYIFFITSRHTSIRDIWVVMCISAVLKGWEWGSAYSSGSVEKSDGPVNFKGKALACCRLQQFLIEYKPLPRSKLCPARKAQWYSFPGSSMHCLRNVWIVLNKCCCTPCSKILTQIQKDKMFIYIYIYICLYIIFRMKYIFINIFFSYFVNSLEVFLFFSYPE